MIICETKRLILRDMISEDIEARIRWEKVDTEWQQWDAPWEYEDQSDEEQEQFLKDYVTRLHSVIERLAAYEPDRIRYSFQIAEKESGRYIGWVNSYHIDENYCYTEKDGLLTIGIDLPETAVRGKGYGTEAFLAVIDYFRKKGKTEIYTQTWSGNYRMVHLAEKLGFKLVCRKENLRTVRGEKYDGLTWVI